MNIVSICGVAVVSAIIIIALRRHNSEIALLISVGAAVIVLLSVIEYILSSIDSVSTMLAQANVKTEYVSILLKVMGISFLTEFTCDTTKEAGLDALTGNISLAGKILVLVTSMPMFMEILSVVTRLSGGEAID